MKPFFAFVACLFGASATSRGEYYNFTSGNTIDGSDILYQETRYPAWPEHTYNARWFPGIAGETTSTSFYSGPTWSGNGETGEREVGYIWSFWGVDKPVRAGDSVVPIWWHGSMADVPSIGEGASGKVEGTWTMSTGVWYPTAVRIWRTPGGPADESFAGQWFKDGATGRWHHLATFRMPFAANRFTTDTGFIEDPSTGNRNPRRVDFRNYYFRRGGKWEAANVFTPSTRQDTEKGTSGLIENGTAAFFETCAGPGYKGNMGPGAQKAELRLTMPETPAFDLPVLAAAGARRAGAQTAVKWTPGEKSSPQFSWKIELLDKQGLVLASKSEIAPDASQVLLATPTAPASVRISFTDIFDRPSTALTVPVVEEKPAPPAVRQSLAPGLDYSYFEGGFDALPAFDNRSGPPVQSGAVNGPDISIRRRNEGFAVRYQGSLRVPATGLWAFSLRSSDGSSLLIDGKEVIDNSGVHGAGFEKSGVAALAAGLHEVDLRYFKNKVRGGEECVLALSWEGPDQAKQLIPDGAWSRSPGADEPQIRLVAPVAGQSVPADKNVFSAAVRGTPDARMVRFYQDDTVTGASFVREDKDGFSLFKAAELAGTGSHRFRARLVYGKQSERTLDSPELTATLAQPAIAPWTFTAIGRQFFPSASSVTPDGTHVFVGDGMNFNWQKITGDATIVAQIARRPSNTWVSQGDGDEVDGWWSGGLIFRDDLNANPGSEIGRRFVTLFASARNSIHMQDHTNHNAGGLFWGENRQNPQGGIRWLKLSRKGQLFLAQGSSNGTDWTDLETRDHSAHPLPAEMYVGVYTLARPSTHTNPPRWKFAHVSLGDNPVTVARPPDLAAWWPMDEKGGAGVADGSGSGLDGVVEGTSNRVDGKKAGALSLSGTDSGVRIPALDLGSNRVTICGWIKREGDQPPWSGIAMSRGSAAAGVIFGPGNELRFNWDPGRNPSYNFSSRLVPPDGRWAFVALAVEPAGATLYLTVDGRREKAVCQGVFDPAAFDGDFWLGNDPHDEARKFKGALDDFRVFRRTLSEAELAKLAESR